MVECGGRGGRAIGTEERERVEEEAPRVEQHVLQVDRVARGVLLHQPLGVHPAERGEQAGEHGGGDADGGGGGRVGAVAGGGANLRGGGAALERRRVR